MDPKASKEKRIIKVEIVDIITETVDIEDVIVCCKIAGFLVAISRRS